MMPSNTGQSTKATAQRLAQKEKQVSDKVVPITKMTEKADKKVIKAEQQLEQAKEKVIKAKIDAIKANEEQLKQIRSGKPSFIQRVKNYFKRK
jgi:hypothetical protein